MRLSLVATPPQRTDGALALAGEVDLPVIISVPSLLADLSEIECNLLGRVAVHAWAHDGDIPYFAPNAHQFAVAMGLASPNRPLLEATVSAVSFRQSFRLTCLGGYVVRRLFRLVPAIDDQRREIEFTKMRQLMRNEWEISD